MMMNFREPKVISLRPYQADAIEALRDGIRQGRKRQLLVAGTGAGKTLTAAHLMNEAAKKGSYSLFIVDRVALVDQTSEVFDQHGIAHGVVQGIHPRWAPREHVQVCSAQTLARRPLPRDPDLIVVDEAHCRYKATCDLMRRYPNAVKVGLTATPFTKGLTEDWDSLVNVIPTRRLIDDGFLIEPKIYIARSPDDKEFGLNSYGEFSDEGASGAGIRIIGDVVAEWQRKCREHFGGPVKTIVFSPTVDHGRELCAAFNATGYNFQQISYLDKDDAERAEKIAEFRRPDSIYDALVSCGVLTKGFDVPEVRCGISCKPYRKSLSSVMQEIGRVMRTCPGKESAIWLDHAGNFERFGLDVFDVWENGAGELNASTKRDSTPRERNEKTREKAVCPECSGALRGNLCMACGWERPARSGVVNVAGEMHEFAPDSGLKAREGLRAACLADPRKVWDAALAYALDHCRDEQRARRWAKGIFHGVYPREWPPRAWASAPRAAMVDQGAYDLAHREVQRFRKQRKAAA